MKLLYPLKDAVVGQGFEGNFKIKKPDGTYDWVYTVGGKKDKHRAFDIKNKSTPTLGAPVICAFDGIVKHTYGNYGIKVLHQIGDYYFWTVYWHCLEIKVKVGDKVKMGDTLATAGGDPNDNVPDGGYTSNPHIHWKFVEGKIYDFMKSVDITKKPEIEMVKYDDYFAKPPAFAESAYNKYRDILPGPNAEIDIRGIQEALVKKGVIKEVGDMPAWRLALIFERLGV